MRQDILTARKMWNCYAKQGRECGMFYSDDLDYVWVSLKGSDMYEWGRWNGVPLFEDYKGTLKSKDIEREVSEYGGWQVQHK